MTKMGAMMRLLLTFFIVFPLIISGQIIPDDRTFNWSVAGQEAVFDDPQEQVSVMDFGAVGDGFVNDAPAIQEAMDSFDGEPGIVFLPEGQFLLQDALHIPSGIVLRGVDSLSTNLLIDFSGEPQHALRISGQSASEFQTVESGYQKGSVKIVVVQPDVFSAGDFVEMLQENGDWDTEPASWAEQSVGQMLTIEAVSGDTLFLQRSMRIDFDEALEPKIRKVSPKENIVIENLRIERLDEPAEGAGSNIYINLAKGIRISDIESDKSVGSHIAIYRSGQVLLEGSYIHHAFTYDGSGTRGYGITLHMHSGECLVENNVFEHLRHAMMVKTGANGNVFGYNYSIDPYRSETIHDYSGDVSLHGHYAFANLFEGNLVQNIIIDHYWGPSGPLNTFFRNRAELYGFIITSSDNPTDQQNIAGLEITNTNFLYGMYTISGEDHYEYGNYITGEVLPFETDSLPDTSYYKASIPEFWTEIIPWPSIGIPLTPNEWDIPAKHRYLGINTSVEIQQATLEVYPNPVSNRLFIGNAEEVLSVRVFGLDGSLLHSHNVEVQTIDVSGFKPGVYLFEFLTQNSLIVKKVLVR